MTTDPGDDPVTAIRNIGPAQAEILARAGIVTATQLRDLGADEAYRRCLLSGTRPHFIMYYVLHMALQGRPWNDCRGAEKVALRRQFDALKAVAHDPHASAFERAMDEIGVLPRAPAPTDR